MSFAQYMVLKKGPFPQCLFTLHEKSPYILHMLHKNFTCWKQFKFFILSGNLLLRDSPFHTVNCLKLFDFTLFFVYTLKLLKGLLWHIFLLYFEKTYLQSLRLQSGSSAFKENNAKTKGESLKEGPRDISEKEGSETTALFAFPDIHPCPQLHTKERTGFIL